MAVSGRVLGAYGATLLSLRNTFPGNEANTALIGGIFGLTKLRTRDSVDELIGMFLMVYGLPPVVITTI